MRIVLSEHSLHPLHSIPSFFLSSEVTQSPALTNIFPNLTDHVCGSAHGLLAPYYTLKQRTLSQTPSVRGNTQLVAKQVSKRGGDLRVHWDEEREVVKIAGEVVRIGSGVLEL
jgi:predicted PhzF superfamily epimerase YddE/YHI9